MVRDASGAVVGAGMRTAPFAPYPLFLLPMPDDAAVALARAVHDRGEEVLGVNGALPAVQLCAAELARLQGGRVEVAQHTRLHELGELAPPAPVTGRLVRRDGGRRRAGDAVVRGVHGRRRREAGRPRGASAHDVPDRDGHAAQAPGRHDLVLGRRDRASRCTSRGRTRRRSGSHASARCTRRPPNAGRGWASNAVADVSRRLRAEGARVCLFTDQANPTSNKIYAALGYRPVVDMANLVLVT